MEEELKQNLQKNTTWMRILYIIIFAIIYWAVKFVIAVIVVFQIFTTLFTAKPNVALLIFGRGLSQYVYQIILFLTFNSEVRPYPFAPWPAEAPETKSEISKVEGNEPASSEEKDKTE